jgi:DNA-binding MarR family transcriptional regulator
MDETRHETAASGAVSAEGRQEAAILQTLMAIAKKVRAVLALHLAEIGLANGQDEVLLALDALRPISVPVLAGRLDIRPDLLTRLIDPLVARGLVTTSGDDGPATRWTTLRVSPDGLALQERIRALWNEIGADLVGSGGSAHLDRLIEDLRTIQTQINRRMTRFC